MASGDSIDGIELVESFSKMNNEDELKGDRGSESEEEGKTKPRGITPLDMTAAAAVNSSGPKTPTSITRHKSERERKIGHRRVGVGGEITYKKIQTTQIMGSIQLGIQHAVGGLASKPERDLLMQDFMTVETTNFPSEGSNHTPAHHYSEFRFRTYAPIAFRYFRDLFGIQPDDFLISMCSSPLIELSNPGASGSIFYLTEDDEFIIKTVQHKEGEFLQKLLPGYYMNLNQNPRTLLPKFFGLYCYQCNSKNVRLVAMNNLLPSYVKMHQKYDLKGSTYKRKASKSERQKNSPTYKDLDFIEYHPEGIGLEADTYTALVKTIQRDCRVLESFKIMDYSLLVGIHNLDLAVREKAERRTNQGSRRLDTDGEDGEGVAVSGEERDRAAAAALNRSRSINRQRLVAHSTAMESIQAESEPIDEEDDVPPGGIPARSSKGERLLLYVGIIDILQSYRLKKKLEHTWKAMIHDGDTVSVHRPGFYAQRFQDFMAKTVFKKIPSLDLPEIKGNHRKFRALVSSYIALKHSPSKRKSISRPLRGVDVDTSDSATGGLARSYSPVPCSSTPPPAFEDALRGELVESPPRHRLGPAHITHHHHVVKSYRESEVVSISDVRLECRAENKSSLSVESSSSTSGFGSGATGRNLTWTPPASVEGSTPTWTEGTPSFTESSSSGDIGCPTTPVRNLGLQRDSEGPKSASTDDVLNSHESEMGSNMNLGEAQQFLREYEREAAEMCFRVKQSQWNFSTNITDANKRRMLEEQALESKLDRLSWRRATSFTWTRLPDSQTRRQLNILVTQTRAGLPDNEFDELQQVISEMKDIYSRARVCPYHNRANNYCDLALEPDLTRALAHTRDYEEQLHLWKAWRDSVGPPIRSRYIHYMQLANKAARINGFRDAGQQERSVYEDEEFESHIDEVWATVAPLYRQLHTYVRRRLIQQYGSQRVRPDGPIPAHLLGNMWAQNWKNLADIVLPYPGKQSVDVTPEMLRQGYTPLRMFQLAEEFYTSMGMNPMPPEFWHHSMLEKPLGRDVVCRASAWDFCNHNDYRIKQCTEVTMEDLQTIHHEMAHIQYYLQYANQPLLFRDGANPGFHEAVGAMIELSVVTPRHLQRIGLLNNITDEYETNINFLLTMALDKIAYLPFAYVVDQWRWRLFSEEWKVEEMNSRWWDLRMRHQGIIPPISRSENDFDPAAKYHVVADMPYIRYFVSLILQFQLHESLCQAAGHFGPLHTCDIYRSREAGRLLSEILSMGSSRSWSEIIHVMTKGRTDKLDSRPLLEYFQPLAMWLSVQNRDEKIVGWATNNEDSALFASWAQGGSATFSSNLGMLLIPFAAMTKLL